MVRNEPSEPLVSLLAHEAGPVERMEPRLRQAGRVADVVHVAGRKQHVEFVSIQHVPERLRALHDTQRVPPTSLEL